MTKFDNWHFGWLWQRDLRAACSAVRIHNFVTHMYMPSKLSKARPTQPTRIKH